VAISTLVANGMLGFAGQAWAGEGCSEGTLSGAYGFRRSGVNPAGVPVDEIAIVHSDGQGNFDTAGWLSLGDDISASSFVGTYVVNPDCSYIGYINGVEVYRGVIVDGGEEVFLLRMNPGAHQRASLKKM
jgi:hypothetical protein